jgi:hypothetical protein
MVISFGSAIFKTFRLLFIAMLSVHIFSCAFYRVKKESAVSQDDVDNFYLVRNTQSTVMTHNLSGLPVLMHVTEMLGNTLLSAGPSYGICEHQANAS